MGRGKNTAKWLVLIVSLGLFAFSVSAIVANGFDLYKLYPFALGLVNLGAYLKLGEDC